MGSDVRNIHEFWSRALLRAILNWIPQHGHSLLFSFSADASDWAFLTRLPFLFYHFEYVVIPVVPRKYSLVLYSRYRLICLVLYFFRAIVLCLALLTLDLYLTTPFNSCMFSKTCWRGGTGDSDFLRGLSLKEATWRFFRRAEVLAPMRRFQHHLM